MSRDWPIRGFGAIGSRKIYIIVFSLFFSWLLSFPFEGQAFYALTNFYNIDAHDMIYQSITAHLTGLILCGFFIRSVKMAKRLMMISIVFCIAGNTLFFFTPSILWNISLCAMSFLAGACVASWGFFLKGCTPRSEQIKTIADGLIFSNILMIVINIGAIFLSPYTGLILALLMLCLALIFAANLPDRMEGEIKPTASEPANIISPVKPLIFLCLFIILITINSGIMYQVINPAFQQHQWLVGWYWAVPYIAALFIMRNLPRKINRTYILYVAIAMMGLSFISFMTFDRSAASYLVVDTLMLGACGVYDLFWWTILGDMLDFNNPAKILGIGLSANVLGVLLGGILGNAITGGDAQLYDPSVLAIAVVFIVLIILPLLHKQLSMLLKDHVYLTALYGMPPDEQAKAIETSGMIDQLTKRESEIAALLLKGRTYKMIAGELFLSENTVKTHIKNIYSKLNIQNKTELLNLLMNKEHPLSK